MLLMTYDNKGYCHVTDDIRQQGLLPCYWWHTTTRVTAMLLMTLDNKSYCHVTVDIIQQGLLSCYWWH